jgi:hypothetical protein
MPREQNYDIFAIQRLTVSSHVAAARGTYHVEGGVHLLVAKE